MKMYLHKHCEGQILLHRAEAYVASDVQLRDMDGNIFINYLRAQFKNVAQLQ